MKKFSFSMLAMWCYSPLLMEGGKDMSLPIYISLNIVIYIYIVIYSSCLLSFVFPRLWSHLCLSIILLSWRAKGVDFGLFTSVKLCVPLQRRWSQTIAGLFQLALEFSDKCWGRLEKLATSCKEEVMEDWPVYASQGNSCSTGCALSTAGRIL